jgi:hypothetical protein
MCCTVQWCAHVFNFLALGEVVECVRVLENDVAGGARTHSLTRA